MAIMRLHVYNPPATTGEYRRVLRPEILVLMGTLWRITGGTMTPSASGGEGEDRRRRTARGSTDPDPSTTTTSSTSREFYIPFTLVAARNTDGYRRNRAAWLDHFEDHMIWGDLIIYPWISRADQERVDRGDSPSVPQFWFTYWRIVAVRDGYWQTRAPVHNTARLHDQIGAIPRDDFGETHGFFIVVPTNLIEDEDARRWSGPTSCSRTTTPAAEEEETTSMIERSMKNCKEFIRTNATSFVV